MPSLAGLKQIVNPTTVLNNQFKKKGSYASTCFDPKGMNFTLGSIGNSLISPPPQQQQQQQQQQNQQRSSSNSKQLQQKYISPQGKHCDQLSQNSNLNSFELAQHMNGLQFSTNTVDSSNNIISAISPIIQAPAQQNTYSMGYSQNSYHNNKEGVSQVNSNDGSQSTNINSTSSKNVLSNSTSQGKSSLNMKRQKSSKTLTPKNVPQPSPTQQVSRDFSFKDQFSSYQSLDKQSHLQSIERIKENINKQLVLQQQQLEEQKVNAKQNINTLTQPFKIINSTSQHKSLGGHEMICPPSNSGMLTSNQHHHFHHQQSQSQSNLQQQQQQQLIMRKMSSSNISQPHSANINSIINGHNSFHPSAATTSASGVFYHNQPVHKNNTNGTSINCLNDNEDSSSTNIIFEKVKNRKMNNLSMGNSVHHSPFKQVIQQLPSQKNLHSITQNKSLASTSTPLYNPNQKTMSKNTSFSGHQNAFYSPTSYIKPNFSNNTPSNQETRLVPTQVQEKSSGNLCTSKAKVDKSNRGVEVPHKSGSTLSKSMSKSGSSSKNNHHNPLSIAAVTMLGTSNSNGNGIAFISQPETCKNKGNLSDGISSSSGSHTHNARTSVSNISPQLFKENIFAKQQESQGRVNNLPMQNGIHLKEPKLFIKNATISFSGIGNGINQNPSTLQFNKLSEEPTHDPCSLNSSSHQNVSQQGDSNNSINQFWQQQKGNYKIIMSKLDAFDANTALNSTDHLSEILSLIQMSLRDTPLEEVIKKFEGNIAKINIQLRQKESITQQSLAMKQRELEQLKIDFHSLSLKLIQKEKESSLQANPKATTPNKKKTDSVTQTTPKNKRRADQKNKDSIIQICDQNGNAQEVDTDKENDMLRDYILEQEKKVNALKQKETKMIRLLLAVKNKGIDIDSIYNAEVVNEESGEDIKKNIPPSNFILNKEKRIKVDSALYRKLDNDQAYADSSIVNDSDESSFGFYGKPSDRDLSLMYRKSNPKQKSTVAKKITPQIKGKFRLDLNNLKKMETEEEEVDEESQKFHQFILKTLSISQEQLDELQAQIEKDPNNLSPSQIKLIQQIHSLQQQKEADLLAKQQRKNDSSKHSIIFDNDVSSIIQTEDNNIIPSDLKNQLTNFSKLSDDNNINSNFQNLRSSEELNHFFSRK